MTVFTLKLKILNYTQIKQGNNNKIKNIQQWHND